MTQRYVLREFYSPESTDLIRLECEVHEGDQITASVWIGDFEVIDWTAERRGRFEQWVRELNEGKHV